jgi:hypothetical protein
VLASGTGLTYNGSVFTVTGTGSFSSTLAFGGGTALDSSTKVVMTDTTQTISGAKNFTGTTLLRNSTANTWQTGFNPIQIGNFAAIASRTTDSEIWIGANWYRDAATNNVYAATGELATVYLQLDGTHGCYTAPAGTAGATMSLAEVFRTTTTANVGIGSGATVSARLHVIATTEQLRIGYDTSNYYSTTVGSTGGVTFNAVGAGAAFTFSDAVTITGLASSSGTNYICSTTTGLLTKSASACSGTEAEWIAAMPALTGDVQWLRQEVSRLAAQVAALGGGR